MKKFLFGIGFILVTCSIVACSGSEQTAEKSDGSPNRYFSLSEYFNEQIDRLQTDSTEVFKTVEVNGKTESKRMRIANWNNEFAPFIDADINKSAWVNSYAIDSTATSLTYTSKEPDLKTRLIQLQFAENGHITSIIIENQVENWIYSARERLSYYPDSVYSIEKEQDIRIVGENRYKVRGEFYFKLSR